MENAFNAAQTPWISNTNFGGDEEVACLHKWGRMLTKEYWNDIFAEAEGGDDEGGEDSTNAESKGSEQNRPSSSPSSSSSTPPAKPKPKKMRLTDVNPDPKSTIEAHDQEEDQRETVNSEESKRIAIATALKEIEAMGDELFGCGITKTKTKKSAGTGTPAGFVTDDEDEDGMEVNADPPQLTDSESDSDLDNNTSSDSDDDKSSGTSTDTDDSNSFKSGHPFFQELFTTDMNVTPSAQELKFRELFKNHWEGASATGSANSENSSFPIIPMPTTPGYKKKDPETPDPDPKPGPSLSTGVTGAAAGSSKFSKPSTGESHSGPGGDGDLGQPTQQPGPITEHQLPNANDAEQRETQERELDTEPRDTSFDNLNGRYYEIKKRALARDPSSILWDKKVQRWMGKDDKQFRKLKRRTTLGRLELHGLPFVDDSVTVGGVMPLLAPPVPTWAIKANYCLALYTNFSETPGAFQWRCKTVTPQYTDKIKATLQMKTKKEIAERLKTCSEDEKVHQSKDVIMTVAFYHRSKKLKPSQLKRRLEPEHALTIEILGSQTLMDLRNHFYCKSDLISPEIQGDDIPPLEINPDALHAIRESHLDKPSAIFVGNTLYRNEASRLSGSSDCDYGTALKDWEGYTRMKVVGPFEMSEMENTRLLDLTFKRGFPYLFIHQGDCEHLFAIEHVRLLNSNDSPLRASYPMCSNPKFRHVKCAVDEIRTASFAVRNVKLFPHETMMICSECLERYCYHEKKKARDFQVYEYHQFSSIF